MLKFASFYLIKWTRFDYYFLEHSSCFDLNVFACFAEAYGSNMSYELEILHDGKLQVLTRASVNIGADRSSVYLILMNLITFRICPMSVAAFAFYQIEIVL